MFRMIGMDHIVLNVIDVDKILNFYTNVLGLEPERLDEFKNGKVKFPSVRVSSDVVIDLFPPAMHKYTNSDVQHHNLNHFCLVIEKDDMLKFIEHLEKHGVVIEEKLSQNWGAKGIGISVYFSDPEGNKIEVRYYEDLRI